MFRDDIAKGVSEYIKESKMFETGEMGWGDIKPGGEYYEWAQSIAADVKELQKKTGGKLSFDGMRPFDKYQGPYAQTNMGKIWDAGIEGENYLYLESKEWIGTADELARALNGDKTAINLVVNQAKKAAGEPVDKDFDPAQIMFPFAESVKERLNKIVGKQEIVETKKEDEAEVGKTKTALSMLRKIHKATEITKVEELLNDLEKEATKGKISPEQETRLKDAAKRRKEALAANPATPETEPSKEEEESLEEGEKDNKSKIQEGAIKNLAIGDTAGIPTGNAQLVYGIEGVDGEEFTVTRSGTMIPVGKYKVIGKPKYDREHSGPWGTFSEITVQKISEIKVDLNTEIKKLNENSFEVVNKLGERILSHEVSTVEEAKLAQKMYGVIHRNGFISFNSEDLKESFGNPFSVFGAGGEFGVYDEEGKFIKVFKDRDKAEGYVLQLTTPIAKEVLTKYKQTGLNIQDQKELIKFIEQNYPQYKSGKYLLAVINGLLRESKVKESKLNEDDPNTEAEPKPEVPAEEPSSDVSAPKTDKEPKEEEKDKPLVTDNIPDTGEEKEYLGSKGTDEFFYIKAEFGTDGQVRKMSIVDATGKELLSSEEEETDILTEPLKFILNAVKKLEIAQIDMGIVDKYILEPKEAEEEEIKPEPSKEPELPKEDVDNIK